MRRVLVAGAGGFIGHHLVTFLKKQGYWVRGVDLKEPEFEATAADEFLLLDLREFQNCLRASNGVDDVYQLAADMGGIGYITTYQAQILRNNTLINSHMLEAARRNKIANYLFTSSACVYPYRLQNRPDARPLKEEDAYPADPDTSYGWEKLLAEQACAEYRKDFGLRTHIARLHSMYGPLGVYSGGREKFPAAISRKIALAESGDAIEVWGDGLQTRSYCYVDDCVRGLHLLMNSDYFSPIQLGQDRLISVNDLVDMVAGIAGKTVLKRHDRSKPQGARGRNADLALVKNVLGWEPLIPLETGLRANYLWVESELRSKTLLGAAGTSA